MTKVEKVTNIVDVALLPKVLGGKKVSASKGEIDDLYCRGVVHLRVCDFCTGLDNGRDVVDSEGRSAFEMVQSIEPPTTGESAASKTKRERPARKRLNNLLADVVDSHGRGAFEMVQSMEPLTDVLS